MSIEKVSLLRYPGGKQRLLNYLIGYFPSRESIRGRFVEPFVGSGAVFFALNPKWAILSDINSELIDLYRGIRRYPIKIWKIFRNFPSTKRAYYIIRNSPIDRLSLAHRAARTLFINRTCFKGMWRHNPYGQFNVGYGGQDRRWVITKETLILVSKKLWRVFLQCSDFEKIIDACEKDDFIFVDPPYRPGEREMNHDHYRYGKFIFDEHKRLAATLKRASARRVRWAMTTSAHLDIVNLFRGYHITSIPKGTGRKIGELTKDSGEVLIRNYKEVSQ